MLTLILWNLLCERWRKRVAVFLCCLYCLCRSYTDFTKFKLRYSQYQWFFDCLNIKCYFSRTEYLIVADNLLDSYILEVCKYLEQTNAQNNIRKINKDSLEQSEKTKQYSFAFCRTFSIYKSQNPTILSSKVPSSIKWWKKSYNKF